MLIDLAFVFQGVAVYLKVIDIKLGVFYAPERDFFRIIDSEILRPAHKPFLHKIIRRLFALGLIHYIGKY